MVSAHNLFSLLEQKKISQLSFAKSIGVSSGNVSDWKNGRSFPNGDTLAKIADYFNVSVDYLLGRTVPGSALPGLAEDERQLIENCRLLNAEGQEKLLDASDDLVQSGKYKKHDKAVLDKNA